MPISPSTVFCLASVSKQFTAAAIMKLFESKKLFLDSPIANYLHKDSYPIEWAWVNTVTVRQLLKHNSGLPSDLYPIEVTGREDNGAYIPGTHDEKSIREHYFTNKNVIQESELFNAKSNSYSENYSNLGYSLLATIVEDISGISFGEFLKQNFFEPIGMESTFVGEYAYHHKISNQTDKTNIAEPLVAKYIGSEEKSSISTNVFAKSRYDKVKYFSWQSYDDLWG